MTNHELVKYLEEHIKNCSADDTIIFAVRLKDGTRAHSVSGRKANLVILLADITDHLCTEHNLMGGGKNV